MGYTHYWRKGVKLTPEIVKDVRKIVRTSTVTIKGGDGTGKPIITTDLISLNGDAAHDEDYETLYVKSGDDTFNFTKMARRPYDEVVCAILIRLAEDGLEVSSDGAWGGYDWAQGVDPEWGAGASLFANALGREAVKPNGVCD